MPVGKILYKLQSRWRHGVKVAYYRDVVARRIFQTAPVLDTVDPTAEVHILMWKGDWVEGVWALKSLYRFGRIRYKLCIHEDGTLTPEDIGLLKQHFPKARIVSRSEADAKVNGLLSNAPRSLAFRKSNPLALKVFDFMAFLEAERLFLMDSDVFIFSSPETLLRRIEDASYSNNTLNQDWGYGYSIDLAEAQALLPFTVPPRVNSGFGLIHRDSVTVADIEKFLSLPRILSHSHRVEQTLFAICSAQYGFDMLPEPYDVHLGPSRNSELCRHYTGPIRHLLYRDGIPRLLRQGLLSN